MSNNEQDVNVIHLALYKILSALSRLLLLHSISATEFIELFKRAYIEVAQKELGIRGRPANKSKIAATTGISRKEVTRICKEMEDQESPTCAINQQLNKNIRLIQAWRHNERYLDKNGQPAPLPSSSDQPDTPCFEELIKEHFGDIPLKAALQELIRNDVAEIKDNIVTLKSASFIPHQSKLDKWAILGTDVKALINTIEHNLQRTEKQPALYQRKVAFRKMSAEAIEYVNKAALDAGQKLLESLAKELRAFRIEDDKLDKETSYFSGLGVYAFNEQQPLMNVSNTG